MSLGSKIRWEKLPLTPPSPQHSCPLSEIPFRSADSAICVTAHKLYERMIFSKALKKGEVVHLCRKITLCIHIKIYSCGYLLLKCFWDHRWISLEPRAQQINDPGAQSWVKSMFHKDFWETASTVFKVLSNIVEEMLTDTAVLILMNMLRLCRASLHSCQDLRPRVTSEVQEEEEEGKAANEHMLLSFSGWAALASAEAAVSWQAELHCRAEQVELPGHKSFSDHKEKFLSQGRAREMRNLRGCQGTHIPDTLRAAALAADMWRVAQQPLFAVNKPILSPDQDSKVSLPAQ